MKGIVFNLLEGCFVAEHGEDAWDALLEGAGVAGAYTSLGNYPDEELFALIQAAAAVRKDDADAIQCWFGRTAMAPLARRYPELFAPHRATRAFVLTLNDIIHPEVRKLYPGAQVPVFRYETRADGRLGLGYASERNMCSFAEGLLQGAAAHFGERAQVEHAACRKRGDSECLLLCAFEPDAAHG